MRVLPTIYYFFDQLINRRNLRLSFETWQLYKLAFVPRHKPGTVQIEGDNVRFVDGASCFAAWNSIFQDKIYDFKPSSSQPLILDVGANIGLASKYFSKRMPQAKILAFEPDPDVYQCLNANCDSLPNVELFNLAIAPQHGFADFTSLPDDSSSLSSNHCRGKTISVRCETLSSILDDIDGEVDLLKIDIEGSEYDVIEEASRHLSKVRAIFIECHSFVGQKQRLGELLTLLTESGFRYHIESEYDAKSPLLGFPIYCEMDARANVFCLRIGADS